MAGQNIKTNYKTPHPDANQDIDPSPTHHRIAREERQAARAEQSTTYGKVKGALQRAGDWAVKRGRELNERESKPSGRKRSGKRPSGGDTVRIIHEYRDSSPRRSRRKGSRARDNRGVTSTSIPGTDFMNMDPFNMSGTAKGFGGSMRPPSQSGGFDPMHVPKHMKWMFGR